MYTEIQKDVRLDAFAEKEYLIYGISVNEDRAIPSGIDGLKPVARRLLWATYEMKLTSVKKCARIIGDTIGKYHPHGDSAAYEALVNMANSPTPTFFGVGNFGNFADPAFAAQRYTNAKLSKYSEKVFFDPFYLNTIEYVPNFDGEESEPCLLPALLPNILLNGTSGIGVGASTEIPAFSMPSVISLLKEVFNGAEITPKLCASKLKFVTKYGADYDAKSQKEQILSIMKTGKGRIVFKPVYKLDEKKGTITVLGFPQNCMEKALEKVVGMKELKSARDASSPEEKSGKLFIEVKPALKANFEEVVNKVQTALSSATSFSILITDRKVVKDTVEVKLRRTTVVEILKDWYEYRLEIEKKACQYWLKNTEDRIHYHEILRLAVANLDTVVKALKEKHPSLKDLNKRISSLLKITEEEAAIITDLKVYRLSSMEDAKLVQTIKDLQEKKKTLTGRYKKPAAYVLSTLDSLAK